MNETKSLFDITRTSAADGTKPMTIAVKVMDDKCNVLHSPEVNIDFMPLMRDVALKKWLTKDELLDLRNMIDAEMLSRNGK